MSSLKKLSPTHTHPLIAICEFSKSYELLFLEFESLIKCKIWIIKKKSLNNFISELSWCRKLSLTHTQPLIYICQFLKTYKLLFLEFESFINDWMAMGKIYSIILSLTCHSLRNFPSIMHIFPYSFVNFWNRMNYYFLSLSHS